MTKESVDWVNDDLRKKARNLELQRNIVVGHIIRKLHKQEGSYGYLVQLLEPYLEKKDRALFGLLF